MKQAKKVKPKKAQEPVEIVVIADRSGSMASIAKDAIGGFNSFLKEQQSVKGKANLTLILFDHEYTVPIERKDLKGIPPLDDTTYVPRGMTAMNDAIGRAITKLDAENPKKAIICILTDGQENSSKEFTTAQVKDKITACEKKGWRVVYLAANQDAFAVGAQYGVQAINTANFAATGIGIRSATATMSGNVTSYRSNS